MFFGLAEQLCWTLMYGIKRIDLRWTFASSVYRIRVFSGEVFFPCLNPTRFTSQ